ncbi:MAG: hypothetical protein QOG65_281, partial [Actinomycetota bacterium]|nr:hypothetical protein [Actinomycetota bacterium]
MIQLGGHGEHGSEEWLHRSVCTRGARMGTVEGTAWEHEMKERL